MLPRFVGIDPGNEGGIVCIDYNLKVIGAYKTPIIQAGRRKVLDCVEYARILRELAPDFTILEKGQSMPQQGIASAYNYGWSNGVLEMGLVALQLRYELVPPSTWMKVMHKGVPGGGGPGKATKGKSILVCQRTLPKLDLQPGRCRTPQDGLAEAACMALYGRLKAGLVPPPPTAKRPPPRPRRRRDRS